MVGKLFCIFLIQGLFSQIHAVHFHPGLTQYLQLPGSVPQTQPARPSYPLTVNKPISSQPSSASIEALLSVLSAGTPALSTTKSLPTLSPNVILSGLDSYPSNKVAASTPYRAFPTEVSYPPTSVSYSPTSVSTETVDASLLNNLAALLQLVLLNNLLNSPQAESPEISKATQLYYETQEPIKPVSYTHSKSYKSDASPQKPGQSKPQTATSQAYYSTFDSQPISYTSAPNTNFIGASSFMDSSSIFGGSAMPPSLSPSRSGFTLMSPYEALNPSPFSDPFSSFSMFNPKSDFQSPYSAILASDTNDYFPFDALF